MRSFLHRYGLILLTGLSLGYAFPRTGLFVLAWAGLIPLLAHTRGMSPLAGGKAFFLSGLTFYLVLLQWLMANTYWAGGWAFVGYVLLSVVMAAYWGVFGMAWIWLRPALPRPLAWAIALPLLWAVMEALQARLFTGFGWGALAYSQGANLPILQWAAVGGAPLVAGFIVAVNGLLAQALLSRGRARYLHGAAALLLLAATHGFGAQMLGEPRYNDAPFRVGVLQPNFSLEMKWDREYTVDMVENVAEKSLLLARTEPLDLFVWPEALVMAPIESPGVLRPIQRLAQETSATVYTGAQRWNTDRGGSLNSSHLIREDGAVAGTYDKIRLAPFGEYVPLSDYIPFVQQVVPAIGDILPGATPKVFDVNGRQLGPLICFEALFPHMARRLRAEGADVLAVITNLGWFGATSAIEQELNISRLRAIETRLPLVHSANTGISGVFDPWGRFQLVDRVFTPDGSYRYLPDHIRPGQTLKSRLGGVFDLPESEPLPLPGSQRAFPFLAAAIVAGLAVWRWRRLGLRPV